MQALVLQLEGTRNAPFPPDVFQLTDDGVAQDITSRRLALDVRVWGGAPAALITLDNTTNPATDGLYVLSAIDGQFRVQITQATLSSAWNAAHAAGLCKAGEAARLVYDLRLTHADGLAEVPCEGAFIIQPGVTL